MKSTYKGKEYNSIILDLDKKMITLPKLKELKIRGYRNKTSIIGDIKSMKENHYIAKRLTNIPLFQIINMLKYKCERLNKRLIQIDKYYPSSQICSSCGYRNKKVKDLSIREWECEKCGCEHDRDYNASLNIMFEGLKKYMMTLG